MRLTVTGRARKLGLTGGSWRGEKRNSCGKELEGKEGIGGGWEESSDERCEDAELRGREVGTGIRRTVTGAAAWRER